MTLACALPVAVAAVAPGQLHPSFGDGGVAVTATAPAGGVDFQNGLGIRADRSIFTGGSSDMGAGTTRTGA